MCVLVSEFDAANRFEQTQLMLSTMKHMGADMDKLEYKFMPGWKHCRYLKETDPDGKKVFVEIAVDFIRKYEK